MHESAQHAVQASDVLLLMLSDADAIKDVLLSNHQPLNLQGKVVLQMGTIGESHKEPAKSGPPPHTSNLIIT